MRRVAPVEANMRVMAKRTICTLSVAMLALFAAASRVASKVPTQPPKVGAQTKTHVCLDSLTLNSQIAAKAAIVACTRTLSQKLTDEEKAKYLHARGDAYFRLSMTEKSIRDIEEALRLAPSNALYTLARGWTAYYREEDTAKAISYAERALKLDPNDGRANSLLARIAMDSGDHARALDQFEIAIAHKQRKAVDRYLRATLLFQSTRYAEAMAHANDVLTAPQRELANGGHYVTRLSAKTELDVAAHTVAIDSLLMLHRFAEAEARADQLVIAAPNYPVQALKADVILKTPFGMGIPRRLIEAQSHAKAAVRLWPKNALALSLYSQTLAEQGSGKDALAMTERSIAALTADKEYRWLAREMWAKARLLRDLKQSDQAQRAAQEAAFLAANLAPVFFNQLLTRLQSIGYFMAPSGDPPVELLKADGTLTVEAAAFQDRYTKALSEAVTACMLDEQCW
jgi:tetratricopeptide (TPR) repeat protein